MIRFEAVSKSYSKSLRRSTVQALADLTLEVGEGEVFGFLGPNGAGKSTAIKILIDLVRPGQGRAFIDGCVAGDRQVRKNVGYLPENPYFYDHLSAQELLWFGGRSAGLSNGEVRTRSEELLRQVDLVEAGSRRLRTYSKGMVQRAGLALALIHDPRIVILDEPMSGLDPLGRKMVVDLILDLKAKGKTVFFSTHILADVERICDRVGIIAHGTLRKVGRLDQLVGPGATLEEVFIDTVLSAAGGVQS